MLKRQTHTVVQGTPEWHALRRSHFTASEAPAMMNVSKFMTRNELLALKKFGIEKPRTQWEIDNILTPGHVAEVRARVLIEETLLGGEELYPTTMTYGKLLASLDGLTICRAKAFEHKKRNAELVAQVEALDLEPHYWVQLEQELHVSGAEMVMFAISDGTPESLMWMPYRAVPGRMESILAGWEQFEADMPAFELDEKKPKVKGTAIMELPSLFVQVVGEVKSSNLPAFREITLAQIERINTDLETDQDFADAEATIKWAKNAEKSLELVKKQAQGQIPSLDEFYRTIEMLSLAIKGKRLTLEELVEREKKAIRKRIFNGADDAFKDHIQELNSQLVQHGLRMPAIAVNIEVAMKGKRTIDTLRNAADSEVARAKIEATRVFYQINRNLDTLAEKADRLRFLFADLQSIVVKEDGDFAALVDSRVAQHRAAEAAREHQATEAQATQALENNGPAHAGTPVFVGVDMGAGDDTTVVEVLPANDNGGVDARLLRLYQRMAGELAPLNREGFAIHFGRAVVKEFANDNNAGVSVAR